MVAGLPQTRSERRRGLHIMLTCMLYIVWQSVEYSVEQYGCPIAIPYTRYFRPTLELWVFIKILAMLKTLGLIYLFCHFRPTDMTAICFWKRLM